jgi:hypothetical protein
LTIVNAFYRADVLDRMDPIRHEHDHVQKRAPSPRPVCSKLMRFIVAEPIGCKCVAYRGDDPMRWPEVWDLFNGELQPPRAGHYELGVARSDR